MPILQIKKKKRYLKVCLKLSIYPRIETQATWPVLSIRGQPTTALRPKLTHYLFYKVLMEYSHAQSCTYGLRLFLLQKQPWVGATQLVWPTKSKILTRRPFTEKLCQPPPLPCPAGPWARCFYHKVKSNFDSMFRPPNLYSPSTTWAVKYKVSLISLWQPCLLHLFVVSQPDQTTSVMLFRQTHRCYYQRTHLQYFSNNNYAHSLIFLYIGLSLPSKRFAHIYQLYCFWYNRIHAFTRPTSCLGF